VTKRRFHLIQINAKATIPSPFLSIACAAGSSMFLFLVRFVLNDESHKVRVRAASASSARMTVESEYAGAIVKSILPIGNYPLQPPPIDRSGRPGSK
jgi:hypothetical protein